MRTLIVAGLVACSGDDGKDDAPVVPAEPFTVVTYNAGLAVGFVPGAESRAPLVAEALKDVEADVICLQEVWLPEHVAAIEAAAEGLYPYTFAPAPRQSSDAGCAPGEVDGLVECVEESCDFDCVDDVPNCVSAECGLDFITLPKDCLRCAMANVGETPSTIAETCTEAPIEYAYGGSFGTMLLSKHPLGTVEEHVFFSTANSRSVLHAELDIDGVPLSVFCTHLTPVFDSLPFPREGTGVAIERWAAEQLDQISELTGWIDEVGGERKILLGDLNTGPGTDDAIADAPAGYESLVAAGWEVPYVALDGRCTFCDDNPLIAGPDDDTGRLIDHVMLKGPIEAESATRILEQDVSADSCYVDLSTTALSDHYGVSAVLSW